MMKKRRWVMDGGQKGLTMKEKRKETIELGKCKVFMTQGSLGHVH